MRILITLIFILTLHNVKSQSVFSSPNLSQDSINRITSTNKKWFLSTNHSMNTGISFFKGGHASFVAMPMTLQLNRRLNENLYAFVNVGVTPAYINFSPSYIRNGFGKTFQSNGYNANSLGLNPSASFGLMYINDAKTFSVSGSFTAEQNNYPFMPFYNGFQNRIPPVRN
ncbi:MAG: hypothetical protein ABIP35_17860 [Ginsengibacter sp.]